MLLHIDYFTTADHRFCFLFVGDQFVSFVDMLHMKFKPVAINFTG